MITLTKNSANTVILTLTEKKTLADPDYLFKLTNDITGKDKIFAGTDLSAYPDRYNEFTITDNPIEIPLSSQMDFSPVGYWSYTIYEMNQASPNDLNPANAVGVLETGKANVISGSPSTDVEFSDDDDIDNVVFDEA